jgi:hypothetical protein
MRIPTRGCFLVLLLLVGAQTSPAQTEPPPLNVFHGTIPQADRIYFVATDGDNANPGTEAEPWATLPHAVSQVRRGEVIVVRGGVYHHNQTISIQSPSGFTGQMITLTAYPGEVPIFDFSTQPNARNYHGIRLNANFWHVIGITVRNASHNGIRMDGSHNILEQVTAYGNYDTGIHMAGGASHNLIKNSDSFHNFNYGRDGERIGNNADGFGAKFDALGPGNRFYGCRAWENSDDGYDFWRAPHTIVVENSWAFGNGDASVFGNPAGFDGGGNGFKLGGDHVHTPHVVRRSMAFDNFGVSGNAKGFDFNNNWGAMTLEHNTAFNNGRNYWFASDPPDGRQHVFLNNLSFAAANNPVFIGPRAVEAGNSWQLGTPVTADMFVSLDTSPARGPRQPDGSLPEIGLLRPVPESVLVDGGVAYGEPFYGSAPDIGAIEYEQGELVEPWIDLGTSDLIAGLRVYDMETGGHWSIREDLEAGTAAYGDSDVTIASVSDHVRVDEWIQTAWGTGPKNYLFTVATLEVASGTSLLVAHADAVANKPEWLNAFEVTDARITLDANGQQHTLTIYRRDLVAGATVSLGRNTAQADPAVPMYLVMLGAVGSVSVDDLPPVAEGAVLHPNYPNPFVSSTTVAYTLAEAAHVTLKVFDLTGREVAELANGHYHAGAHSVVWAPDHLASGVYVVRLTAGNVVETRRIVIAR